MQFRQYQNVELEQMLNDVLDANNGQNQVEFEAEDIAGTMITFYTPNFFKVWEFQAFIATF